MKVTRLHLLILLLVLSAAAWLVFAWIEYSGRPAPNYSRIDDGLYVGGYVQAPPRGTQAVLNLCEEKDPYEADVHVWEAIRDAEPVPTLEWLRKKVEFIDQQRQADRTVYIHCRNGVSRSVMVTAAYYMWKKGWTRDEALEFIRSKRPEIRPNPAFRDFLLEWEKELRGP